MFYSRCLSLCFCLFAVFTVALLNAQSATFESGFALDCDNFIFPTSIAVAGNDDVIIGGGYVGTCDFDPQAGETNLIGGVNDMYLARYSEAGELIWASTFPTATQTQPVAISETEAGDLLVFGYFAGLTDFDPSPAQQELTPLGPQDFFLLKLNANGEFIWVKQWGQFGNFERAVDMELDDDGNIYLTGEFSNAVDFDPGPGTAYLQTSPNFLIDTFILKLDENGLFVWARSHGAGNLDTVYDIEVNGDYIYIGGSTDPEDNDLNTNLGEVENIIGNSNYNDGYIIQLDLDGNYIWSALIGDGLQSAATVYEIQSDDEGNIFVCGIFSNTATFNPTLSGETFNAGSTDDIFLCKLDSEHNYLWTRTLEGNGYQTPKDMIIDDSNNLYLVGGFSEDIDFNWGVGVLNASSNSASEDFGFVFKSSQNGNLIYATPIGNGPTDAVTRSLNLDSTGDLWVFGGYNNSFNLNPLGEDLMLPDPVVQNVYIAQYDQGFCPDFTYEINNFESITCEMNSLVSIQVENGQEPIEYYWSNDPQNNNNTAEFNEGGFYELEVLDAQGCSQTHAFLIDEPDFSDGLDLISHVVVSSFQVIEDNQIDVLVVNNGCIPSDATISLLLPENVIYQSSSISPSSIDGQMITWEAQNLSYDGDSFHASVFAQNPLVFEFGEELCFTVNATGSNEDVDPTNNEIVYCDDLIGSYDPNDKQVYPTGLCPEHYTLMDVDLRYTVRFQNTGTAAAINVAIIDTLSDYLDPQSLRILQTSHTMITELYGENVIKFRFDDILLPDSSSNPLASQGFVVFEIEHRADLEEGTFIENKAEIYFDFNEPIVTNSVFNTLTYQDPEMLCITGINDSNSFQKELKLHPNPASDVLYIDISNDISPEMIQLIDLAGRTVQVEVVLNSGLHQTDVQGLQAGTYILILKEKDQIITRKIVIWR